jgi:polysaccharide biosynthesis transport protein
MLQYRAPVVQLDENGPTSDVPFPAEPSFAETLSRVFGFVRRQYLIIFSLAPFTLGIAFAYLYVTPRLYNAEARLLIDTGKVQVLNQQVFGEGPVSLAVLDSQIEILKSDNFLLPIVRNLHLAQDPEFISPQGLLGRARKRLLDAFRSPSFQSEALLEQRALASFLGRLNVSRLGFTYVIEVDFQSRSPDRAAQIANEVADAFVRDQIDSKYQTIGRATAWLQDRLTELRAQASAAEHAVVEYKTRHNIVDTGGHLINEQQLSEINTALVKARADTAEARARLDRVSQIVKGNDLDPSGAEVATVADALHNEIIVKLRQQYLELVQRQSILTNRLGGNHLAVVNIRTQVSEIRRSIFDEFKRIAEAYKSEYDIAKERENSLQASLSATVAGSQTTNAAQIELRQLESSAQSYRALYDSFQKRYADFAQQQSFPITGAQVVRALPPTAPSSPKSSRILAMGAAGGLAVGFGLALLREMADRVFRTSSQVETRLKTECVAMLPSIKPNSKKDVIKPNSKDAPFARNTDNASGTGARIIASNAHLFRHVVDSPLSQFTETLRAVKVTIDLASRSKSNKVVGITSSLPDEGKSTVSVALARLCALGGARVVLVDCDLRKRSLSHDLTPNATKGLMDVITQAAKLDEILWTDPASKLSFLPVVAKTRLTHTSEILASAAMKELFKSLRETYDYVIVDLSPLAPVVDVRAATQLLDCYLFVVEWGKTRIDVVERALNTSRGVYHNLLGVILNKVDFEVVGRYDYGSYYSRYGYYAGTS